FIPIVAQILAPEARAPPLPPHERRAVLSRTCAGRRLLEVSALSPLEFVEREFEHPAIQAGLLFFNGLREVDLRLEGFGHHIAAPPASKPATAKSSSRNISLPPHSIRTRRFPILSPTNSFRASCASARKTSATISWRRCSRSTSISPSRRATARAPRIRSSPA